MKPLPKPNLVLLYEHYELRIEGPDRGGWRKAQCPLPDHEDQNPSASINEEECKWHCHACDESGDGIDMIMRRTGAGFADAKRVAEGFLDGSSGPVSPERGHSGLLPRASRDKQGGSVWRPPWASL